MESYMIDIDLTDFFVSLFAVLLTKRKLQVPLLWDSCQAWFPS